MSKIELGKVVRDKVSGYEGVCTSRVEFMTGCVQYAIQPKVDKDGKLPDVVYFDEGRLEMVSAGPDVLARTTGGHMGRETPRR